MKKKRDYYEVLGVARNASLNDLKRAYRELAKRHHPDRNPGDKRAEELFKEASEAYAVLADPQKRARYDRFGHEGVGGIGAEGFPGFNPDIFADLEDVLGSFFGFSMADLFGGRGGGARRAARRGADLRYDLDLEFMEAATGIERELEIPRLEGCEACRGSGARGGAPSACPRCRGRGQTIHRQGFFTLSRTCGECGGTGHVIAHPCPECRGEGRRRGARRIKVRIPAGVDSGMRMRIPGEGEGGRGGGRPGDLYVVIRVREHPQFRRDGADLLYDLPITISQAVLGAEVEVPTLERATTLRIPPGTRSGTVFRIRGKGMPHPNGGARGDLFVTAHISVPGRLSRKQRELFERLRELEHPAEPPGRDLFDRVRDIFN
ncbi:MAG: molecular chaperone DnaJ [Acidobacteriota bacterium]